MRGGLATLGVDENARRRELVGVVMRMALVVGSRGGIAGAIVSLCLKLGSISREDFWELAFGCKVAPAGARSRRRKLFRLDGVDSTLFFSCSTSDMRPRASTLPNTNTSSTNLRCARQDGPKTETSRAKAPAKDRFHHIQAGQ